MTEIWFASAASALGPSEVELAVHSDSPTLLYSTRLETQQHTYLISYAILCIVNKHY